MVTVPVKRWANPTKPGKREEDRRFAIAGKQDMIPVNRPLFRLGRLVATPDALASLERAGQSVWDFLTRHVQGDFGEVDAEDREANLNAIKSGERILSAYKLRTGERLWIITEADRSSSCVLLPENY